MHEKLPISLEEAIALHRKGNLPAAQTAYKALLAASPNHPFLLGQLGALSLRRGRALEAETLLRRALAAGGNPRVRLCNLQTYLGLIMRRKDREEEARELVAPGIPDWPQGVKPSPAERNLLLSLAQSLIALDQPEQGARLLDQAFPDRAEDAGVLYVEGRLRLAVGDAEGAVRVLEHAVKLAPKRPAPLIALSAVQAQMDRRAEAQEAVKLIVQRFAYLRKPRRHRQTPTILVLNPPPREIENPGATIQKLHFRFNFPSELPYRLGDRYRFLSVFETIAPNLRPWEADEPSVVLNNLVDEEQMNLPSAQERVRRLVDNIGLPVINPPDQVFRISREKNAETLAATPGLKVPRIKRYRVADQGITAVAADIEKTIGYPAILRPPGDHASSEMVLSNAPTTAYRVANAQEARHALAESRWQEVYAIEFVDLRKTEGWYRKIRAFFVGGEIIISSGGYFNHWMTAGHRWAKPGVDFYRANPAALERARAFLVDPAGELGPACLETLRHVRDRMRMDIFGMDFDVDDTGQVVLFEATPAMIVAHPTQGVAPGLEMPVEPLQRIHAAFHKLVERRIAEGASRP